MENCFILDPIAYQPDLDALGKRLRVRADSPHARELEQLAQQAADLTRPKAAYRISYIESKDDDAVVIEGVAFHSRVLRVNLDVAHHVFVYLATCGRELDAWAHELDDALYQYWADVIKEAALHAAIQALNAHVDATHAPGRTTVMNPGSLADWPIRQQRPLFSLLGDLAPQIGVTLTDSYLMVPNKTVSGFRFPIEEDFASCELCPREGCPGRRAPYDETLYQRKYAHQR